MSGSIFKALCSNPEIGALDSSMRENGFRKLPFNYNQLGRTTWLLVVSVLSVSSTLLVNSLSCYTK